MNRSKYFEYIEEKLNLLALRVKSRGKLNILNLNIYAENFYGDLLKNIYGWSFKNLNEIKSNQKAIDLVCIPDMMIAQVSAVCTKKKVQKALDKIETKRFNKYSFKFISISENAENLRKGKYKNSLNIFFEPQNDIYDIDLILKKIINLGIDEQKKIYEFIKKELGEEVDIIKIDSNLAIVVNILSKENNTLEDQSIKIDYFEIDRKISFNNLNSASIIINDYKINHNSLDKIYLEFDKAGVNKSSSVLATIRKEYIKNINIENDDKLFFLVIDNILKKVLESSNLKNIPIDELEICVNILVVDAFIRCKIFKNPKDYKYVITG